MGRPARGAATKGRLQVGSMLNRMDNTGPEALLGGPDAAVTPAVPAPQGTSEFQHVVSLAARLARAPIALITGERVRQAWSDPALDLDAGQLAGLHALCQQLGGVPAAAVVSDATQDPRLWHDPGVAGAPHLRFIASLPLLGAKGNSLGVLCVMDVRPRPRLLDEHADALADLAALAVRMLERQAEAESQVRAARGMARVEQVEAAVSRAPSCEAALSSMLVTLCRHHGAAAGYVGRLASTSRVMKAVGHFKDDTALGDALVRAASVGATPETSHAAMAIQSGTPRTLTFPGSEPVPPGLAEAVRAGLRAEVIQPLLVLDDRFGIVLMFTTDGVDLDAVAEDLGTMVRTARPALYRKAADRRLRLLGTALDRANDAVLITEAGPLGPMGPKIVYANDSFCRESGYPLDEVLGEAHGMLHGRGTDMAAVAGLRQAMRSWKPARAELLNYRRDGSEFWAELDLTPIMDEAGLPTHWVSIQRDVTERRRTEAIRQQHVASFRMLFQDNPLPMVVVSRTDTAILEVNDAAIAQYGWDRATFLSRTMSDLSPDGEPFDPRALPASTTHLRGDGTVIEVRAIVHDTVYEGQEATLAVLWDVTEHEATRRDMHHANEMLRQRTQQLHARTDELAEALRLARMGTWRMSVDRQDVDWSREMYDLMGVSRDTPEMGSEALLQRIHPDDRDTVRKALVTATTGRGRHGFEYRVLLPDGDVRHLLANVRPVEDETGAVSELFGYSQDISDRKRTEQVLLRNESLRALGQLTGGVAHDFNNLLTVVILNLEESLDVLPPEHELQEVLSPALHAAVRGADLTSQLLSYARRATLRPERVRPDEFFGALRPLLNRVLGERFELQVLLRHNGGSAMVDPAQLDSAIMNLVINARDAMAQGGTIVLETRSVSLGADSPGFADEVVPGRYVVISVADRGAGIPADLLPRVFEPFFTTKEAGKGSGMGLSMVYGFARQTGGHVTIDSTPDQGTTVRLFLPIAEEELAADWVEPAEASEWAANGLRVLLVEDQENVLRTVARMLRALGFDVTPAMSTVDAFDSLDREPPFDLLFTDIVLPGPVDGLALAEEVQARAPTTRILLTSGFTEHSLSSEDVNGVDFLMKPYKKHDLQAKFTAMFPRSGMQPLP